MRQLFPTSSGAPIVTLQSGQCADEPERLGLPLREFFKFQDCVERASPPPTAASTRFFFFFISRVSLMRLARRLIN